MLWKLCDAHKCMVPINRGASNRYRFEFWNDPDYGGIIVKRRGTRPRNVNGRD